jgi:serine/threonine-protein kinase
MLTGGPPFVGRTLTETVTRILRAPVVPIPGIPPALDAAIARALAKSAAERFAGMEEFAAALA